MSWFVGASSSSLINGYLVTGKEHRKSSELSTSRRIKSSDIMLPISRSDKVSRSRKDSVMEPVSILRSSDDYDCDCNLSKERDVLDLIDAVTKLLRYTELCINDQRSIVSDLKHALAKIMPGEITTSDKSLVISTILKQVNNLSLDHDSLSILPIVRKLVAVVEL